MSIRSARDAIGRVFFQRCFYLFVLLLALITGIPFIEPTANGRIIVAAVNAAVVIATVAAVGRSVLSFVIAVLLAAPTLLFNYIGLAGGQAEDFALSWCFAAGLYAATIVYLLIYVFQPEVMTADKLYGAASAYLLIGILWMFLYAILDYYHPGSFVFAGEREPLQLLDLLYFSFTVLTSTGFGDITPFTRQARAVVVAEQLVGALFIAILIARLAGVYPPLERRRPR